MKTPNKNMRAVFVSALLITVQATLFPFTTNAANQKGGNESTMNTKQLHDPSCQQITDELNAENRDNKKMLTAKNEGQPDLGQGGYIWPEYKVKLYIPSKLEHSPDLHLVQDSSNNMEVTSSKMKDFIIPASTGVYTISLKQRWTGQLDWDLDCKDDYNNIIYKVYEEWKDHKEFIGWLYIKGNGHLGFPPELRAEASYRRVNGKRILSLCDYTNESYDSYTDAWAHQKNYEFRIPILKGRSPVKCGLGGPVKYFFMDYTPYMDNPSTAELGLFIYVLGTK